MEKPKFKVGDILVDVKGEYKRKDEVLAIYEEGFTTTKVLNIF